MRFVPPSAGVRPSLVTTEHIAGTSAPERAAHEWRDPLARAGFAARGVLYLVVGLLAIQFAVGDESSSNVNQTGAIEAVIEQPGGKFLVILIIAGVVALFAFRGIQAALGDPIEGEEATDRLRFAGKAAIYAVMVVSFTKVLVDNWSSAAETGRGQGDRSQKEATSFLFDLPAGRLIVGAVGLGFIAFAGHQFVTKAVKASFMKRLAPPPTASDAVETVGRIGYAARSVIFATIGVFLIVAAVQYQADESKGLSGSLRQMAQYGWGDFILWAIAIGLFLFGVFCLAESRYRRST